MLGHNNARLNELEAENRTLRADLLAAVERADALRSIIATLQRENETLTHQWANMAAVTRNATQQAQAARGLYVIGEDALDRVCVN